MTFQFSDHPEVSNQVQRHLKESAARDLRNEWDNYVSTVMSAAEQALAIFASELQRQANISLDRILLFFSDQDLGRELGQILRNRAPNTEELIAVFYDTTEASEISRDQILAATLAMIREFLGGLSADERLASLADSTSKEFLEVLRLQQKHQPQGESALRSDNDSTRIDAETIQANNVVSGIQIQVNTPINAGNVKLDSLRSAYLNNLFESLRYVNISAVNPGLRNNTPLIHLDALYTSLFTKSSSEDPGAGEHQPQSSVLHRCIAEDRVILLGGPGSGKSTFVSFLAMCLAGEQLGRREADLSRLFRGESFSEWEIGKLNGRIPVRVVLRELIARKPALSRESLSAESLWEFVSAELSANGLADYGEELREELLTQGGIVLFDGLDEVPDADMRRTQIVRAISDFSRSFYKCRIIVTCRTYSYGQKNWALDDFWKYYIAPLSVPQMAEFVQNWYVHIGEASKLKSPEIVKRTNRLQKAIYENARLQELGGNPLLLTLMCTLHAWRGGDLPESREELYRDAVQLLLEWWEGVRLARNLDGSLAISSPSLTEWLSVRQDEVLRLLSRLAFEVHAAQPEASDAGMISESELIFGLTQISRNRDVRPQRLIEYLLDRTGLLISPGIGLYTFPHRIFQEYLAACHLAENDFPDRVVDLLLDDPSRWLEVILLVAARIRREMPSILWALAEALCFENPPDSPLPSRESQASIVAAQILAESDTQLVSVSRQHLEKIDRVRAWNTRILASDNLPLIERLRAGRYLAKLQDRRPEVMSLDRMQFCYISPSSWFTGRGNRPKEETQEEKARDLRSIDYPYWIGRYPVSVAQVRELIGSQDWEPEWANLVNGPAEFASLAETLDLVARLAARWSSIFAWPSSFSLHVARDSEWEMACRGGVHVPEQPLVLPVSELIAADWSPPALKMNPEPHRLYPWGSQANRELLLCSQTALEWESSPLGCVPGGRSPYGAEEMVGTVKEWVTDPMRQEMPRLGDSLRGGSIKDNISECTCTSRQTATGNGTDRGGFRIVISFSRL